LAGALAIGGATRILIIDDDSHSGSAAAAHQENGAREEASLPPDADHDEAGDTNGRPMLHEYQVGPPLDAEVTDGNPESSVVRELIARVEELLHRTRRLPAGGTPAWAGTIRFGSVTLEPATQTVLRGGQPVRVTHTEFRLLLALMRRRGAIASRIELLREVWGAGTAVSRRAVDTHIARLRRKLEDDPANPRHILTALAWGYRFRP
jgi:Transcriptional regulatory protein, C terminal